MENERHFDKLIDKDEVAERLFGHRYYALSAFARSRVDHVYDTMTRKVDAPHTQTVANDEPLERRLATVELENERLRQDNFELELERDELRAELEELRAQWNS